MTGIPKAMVCAILSVDGAYKRTLAGNPKRVTRVVAAVGFLSHCLSSPLPYATHCITVNKIFPSFHPIINLHTNLCIY